MRAAIAGGIRVLQDKWKPIVSYEQFCVEQRAWLAGCGVRTDSQGIDRVRKGQPVPGTFWVESLPRCLRGAAIQPGHFLFWLPAESPPRRNWVSLAASRLPVSVRDGRLFVDAVRTSLARMDPNRDAVVTSAGTTCHGFVQAWHRLTQFPVVEFRELPAKPTRKWFREQAQLAMPSRGSVIYFRAAKTYLNQVKLPARDAVLAACSDRIRGLAVRAGGHVEAALSLRLSQGNCRRDSVELYVQPELTPRALSDRLVEAGAIRWYVEGQAIRVLSEPPGGGPILDKFPAPAAEYLYHWTRRETASASQRGGRHFLRLLAGVAGAGLGAIESVLAILSEMTLKGTRALTRGDRPVVCFSARPANEWSGMRQFRAHLGRWDFEPYGIALSRQRLSQLGAQPVIYGDEATWDELEVDQRPYFQLAHAGEGRRRIDWRKEQEWRILDQVDLRLFGPEEGFVFVPDETAARFVAGFSRWPVTILASSRGDPRGP